MKSNITAKAYLIAVFWMAAAMLLATASSLPFGEWRGLVAFFVLCGIAQIMPVSLFRSSAVSVAAAVAFAGMVLFGPAAGIWINLGSGVVAIFRPKLKPLHKAVFNISNHTISAGVSGVVYVLAGGRVRPGEPVAAFVPIVLASVVFFAVQTGLISAAIALTERTSFIKVWDTNFRWSALNFVALGVIGLGMATAQLTMGATGIAIFSIPLVMAWYSFRLYMAKSHEVRIQNEALKITNDKLEQSYVSTVRALAAAVDAKDHYTHGHSELTMRYAVAIARQLGLSEDEIADVQIAALLHDVGKIGTPDGILNKQSELTEEEWSVIKEHPSLGAKVIQQVDVLSSAVDAVRHHHERYDGSGYPNGLHGDEIPLASQIIAVADAFQAMTSSRPYRRAYSHEYALQELKRCAGTQFSRRVVDATEAVMMSGQWVRDVAPTRLPWVFHSKGTGAYANIN